MEVLKLFVLFCLLVRTDASEPYCRQFDYDQNMLSKMIKTEIAMEAVQKEFVALQESVDKRIESGIEENSKRMEEQAVDGGWGSWSDWSACTTSCGGGIQSRYRSCDHPARYLKGKMCEGPPMELRSCATEPCQVEGSHIVPRIGFTAFNPASMKSGALTFSLRYSNFGENFNMDTGKFVCDVQGLYLFMATILTSTSTSNSCYCRIYVGSTSHSLVYAQTKHTGDHPSGSASLVIQLNKGDEVYLGGCYNVENFNSNTHFTGVLIQ